MNILIADDHAIVRNGLIQLLKQEFPSAEISEACDSHEVFKLIKEKDWSVILMDISMPGRNGLETLKQLRADGVVVPVLMLSMHSEEQYAVRVLKAGASGFLNKQIAMGELVTAVHRVISGRRYVSESLAEKLADGMNSDQEKLPHELLSDREMQVLQLLAGGKSATDIAEQLSLSINTISTYRTRVLDKLGLNNNMELTRYALENGLT